MLARKFNHEAQSMPRPSAEVIPLPKARLPLKAGSPTAPPWNVLRVTPMMERKVAEALTEAGLRVYAPIERYRPASHWRPRTRPLIPGYVFAELPTDRHLDLARANHAVRDVMCLDGRPLRIPPLSIGSLILFEAWGAFDRTVKPPISRRNRRKGRKGANIESRWKNGQRVKVKSKDHHHPFEGYAGEVFRADAGARIQVLINLFGRATSVEVDEDWLEEEG